MGMSFARDAVMVMEHRHRDVAIYLFEYARQNNVVRPDGITSKRRNQFTSALRKTEKIFPNCLRRWKSS